MKATMLSLDSQGWSKLTHAYGDATDIPDLLRQLESFPVADNEKEPWFSIWSSLAHQGDVFSASFAAVPHIINALSKEPSKASYDYFQFPAWVEICRHNNNVKVPGDLAPAYKEALNMLPSLIAAASVNEWDEGFARCAMAALAVAKGCPSLGQAALELSPDILSDFTEWLDER